MENSKLIYKRVADEILKADKILFITGAGISADSGMPTYRGIGGLYNNDQTEEGISIEDAISGNMLKRRPDITWKYLWQLGKACADAEPNHAHKIITEIQKLKPDTWVLTQNVDNLHRMAGNTNLIEIHGNAFELYCTKCYAEFDSENITSNYRNGNVKLPPKCGECGGIVRPKVVLFGEMLPEKAINKYYDILRSMPDLVISIGTSSLFPYIQEPVMIAVQQGAATVEINPGETSISQIVKYKVTAGAAEAMTNIRQEINSFGTER
ncbi:MAG: NAD-dependent deacylase [Victivallales bacterium]|nr:NAD-dependent deacylase [Victivallales bacterium]MCF7888732.1 NAD-dependent deacylase [Victivallales bacterium]